MELLDEHEFQSDQAEAELLGAVAFAPDALAAVLASLPGQDFYHPSRGDVWNVLRERSEERKSLNPAAVARHMAETGQLNDGCARVIRGEMANAQPAHYAAQNARLVADFARKRELVQAVKRAYITVREHPGDHSETLAAVRGVFDEIGEQAEQRLGGTLNWQQLLDEFEHAHDPNVERDFISTPWAELNELIEGLFGGRMYVVGGSAGDGKSTVALNMAAYAAACGRSVLVFSKEMPTVDVTGRIVARGAEVNLAAINGRRLNDFDRARYRDFRKRTANYQLRVNADPVSITGVKQFARSLHHRGHLDLLIVDYLQLLNLDKAGRNAEEEIGRISKELKNLSMELGVPVVVPAQLNRNPSARADGRPTKADLRQSGQIEQDADVVILLWRRPIELDPHTKAIGPDPHNLTLIVDKNRHGPKDEFQLRWNGGYGQVG
jgi:replicative DNA helicase